MSLLPSFPISQVWHRAVDRAMRDAVLWPFFPAAARNGRGVLRTMPSFVKIRRGALSSLRRAGWTQAQGKRGLTIGRCHPFGVTVPSTWACRLYRWCPFCWAREVTGDWFTRLTHAYLHDSGHRYFARPVQRRFRLVLGTYRWHEAKEQDLVCLGLAASAEVSCFRGQIPTVGASSLITIEPFGAYWELEHRFLALLAPETEVPTVFGPRGPYEMRVYDRVTRKELGEAVARATQYPVRLLSEPRETAALLDALQGRRLAGHYGKLRGTGRRRGATARKKACDPATV